MKLNAHQLKILDHMKSSNSLIVTARAGSGKTTTIEEAIKSIPEDKKIACLAFNKDIVRELRKRLPKHVDVETIHGMGLKILNIRTKSAPTTKKRISDLITDYFEEKKPPVKKWDLKNLIFACLLYGYFPDDYKKSFGISLSSAAEQADLELTEQEIEAFKPHVDKILSYYIRSVTFQSSIDFDDMIYSVVGGDFKPRTQYDYVFVDEAQDQSYLRLHLLFKLLKPNGKFVAIGDPAQAIYEFAGAHSQSMSYIKEYLECDELTIPVTQRCSLAIVKEAQKLVPDIKAKEGAIEGKVERLSKDAFWDTIKKGHLDDDTMILCRNNAPLFELAFDLIKNNVKFNFYKLEELKKEFISKIITVNSQNPFDIRRYHEKELEKLNDKLETLNPDSSKYERTSEKRDQQYDFLQVLNTFIAIPKIKTTADLIAELNLLCNSDAGVKLSTVHKSKGLEARTTIIFREELFKETDKNLMYVAITRSKEELYYLNAA